MTAQRDDRQISELHEVIDRTAWGNRASDAHCIILALRLMLDATQEDFWLWESEALERGHEDEFSVTPEELSTWAPEWKRAYIGRLVRTAALSFGVHTEFGGPLDELSTPSHVDSESIASLFCDLFRTVNRQEVPGIRIQDRPRPMSASSPDRDRCSN